jgi:2-haloacid dehalogenase
MPSNRREFLQTASAGLLMANAFAAAAPQPARAQGRYRAVAFDGFPIFDPRPVFARGEQLYPGRGAELGNAWRGRIFEYTWLRTTADNYRDFLGVIEDALVFAARSLNLELPAANRRDLVQGFMQMPAWPDVKPALMQLRAAGLRLGFLNNFTPAMLDANTRSAGLDGFFEFSLSVDAVKLYKPHPRTYRMGVDALGLPKQEILFAAFAGWDAVGAKLFGYPTFWLNRMKQPAEELGASPDATGTGMDDLVRFALA